jgi:hypothetical protein
MVVTLGPRLRFEIVFVTPAVAEEWLELSAGVENRPLSPVTVWRYKRSIQMGEWRLNGETVVRDERGRVLDGQNRLNAIVKAGIGAPLIIVSGVDPDAYKTINQGKVRTGGDTLATAKRSHARSLATALRWLQMYETDNMLSRTLKMSNMEIYDKDRANPGMRDSLEFVVRHAKTRGLFNSGPFAFLHYVCNLAVPEGADFFEQLFSGMNLKPNAPATRLRRWLEERSQDTTAKSHTALLENVAVTVQAWNCHVTGEPMPKVLRWRLKDGFPALAEPGSAGR